MSTKRLFEFILGIAIFAMSVRELVDADLWWHLRTGEAIVENGRIPATDIFSFTIPDHVWIVQQWLTDSFMWLLYQSTGMAGLMVVFALIVTVAFMLVYLSSAGRPYLAAAVLFLAYLCAALPIGVRPQMVNMLFLAIFIFIVERVRQQKWPEWTIFLLPLITWLWANMHSGYLTGIVILGAYFVGDAGQQFFKKADDLTLATSAVWKLGLAIPLSVLLAMVNPSGLDLLLFPLGTLSSDAIQSNIVEWFSPDFHSPYWLFFGVMLAVGAGSFIFSNRPVTLADLLLFFGTGWMGLTSVRHIPLFALTATPIIARHLLSALQGSKVYPVLVGERTEANVSTFSKGLNTAVLLLMILVVIVWVQIRVENVDKVIEETFPVAAVDYIEENGLHEGNIFNAYDWGGYLIWRRIPVFIDGRTELYGDEFFRTYLQTFKVLDGWERPLNDYNVDYVLTASGTALTTLLQTSDEWDAVFEDEMATVFVRN